MVQLPRLSLPCLFLLCLLPTTLVPHPFLFLRQPIKIFLHHRLQFLLTPHLFLLVYLLPLLLLFYPLLFKLPTNNLLSCLITT
jgi:hypothetical protein